MVWYLGFYWFSLRPATADKWSIKAFKTIDNAALIVYIGFTNKNSFLFSVHKLEIL
jgi:hypothetical protein